MAARIKPISLTKIQLAAIDKIIHEDKNEFFTTQAKAIWLLYQNYTIQQIAKILKVSVQTLYHWHQKWEKTGFDFLLTDPPDSLRVTLSLVEEEALNRIIRSGINKNSVRHARAILLLSQDQRPKAILATLSITYSTLWKWRNQWHEDGLKSLFPKRRTQSFKLTVSQLEQINRLIQSSVNKKSVARATAIKLLHEGRSPKAVASVLSVSYQVVNKWRKLWIAHGMAWLVGEHNATGKSGETVILQLSAEEIQQLQIIVKQAKSLGSLSKARAILMLDKKSPIDQIADTLNTGVDVICRWLREWQSKQFNMFSELERPQKAVSQARLVLTSDELQFLETVIKTAKNRLSVIKAEALLMLYRNCSITEVGAELLTDVAIVEDWLQQWQTHTVKMFREVKSEKKQNLKKFREVKSDERQNLKIDLAFTDQELRMIEVFIQQETDSRLIKAAGALLLVHYGHAISVVASASAIEIEIIYAWIAEWQSKRLKMFMEVES